MLRVSGTVRPWVWCVVMYEKCPHSFQHASWAGWKEHWAEYVCLADVFIKSWRKSHTSYAPEITQGYGQFNAIGFTVGGHCCGRTSQWTGLDLCTLYRPLVLPLWSLDNSLDNLKSLDFSVIYSCISIFLRSFQSLISQYCGHSLPALTIFVAPSLSSLPSLTEACKIVIFESLNSWIYRWLLYWRIAEKNLLLSVSGFLLAQLSKNVSNLWWTYFEQYPMVGKAKQG